MPNLCQIDSRLSYVSDKQNNYHCGNKGKKVEGLPSEYKREHEFICYWDNKENYCHGGESCNLSYHTVVQPRNLLRI